MPNNSLIKKNLELYNLDLNVSRETIEKLELYKDTLIKWQKTINLISKNTISDIILRHFIDSAQLIKYIENKNINIADFGSGAGFPGLILAIMGVKHVHLIESDIRKATFLREVSRETLLDNVTIHSDRIENVKLDDIDIVTARALAPLNDLIRLTQNIGLKKSGHCLFLKGENSNKEIIKALKYWNFDIKSHKSITRKESSILEISKIRKINVSRETFK